jgi:hypothetical protein
MATCCDHNNDWIHSCATKVIVYHLITYLLELKTLITQLRHSKKQKMQPNCHNCNNDENPVQSNKEFSHCKGRSMKLALMKGSRYHSCPGNFTKFPDRVYKANRENQAQ